VGNSGVDLDFGSDIDERRKLGATGDIKSDDVR
jgi:hypothetical protein